MDEILKAIEANGPTLTLEQATFLYEQEHSVLSDAELMATF